MTANRDLPPPLVVVTLLFIQACAASTTASPDLGMSPTLLLRPRGSADGDIELPSYDYYDTADVTTPFKRLLTVKTVAPVGSKLKRCDYDVCVETQISCAVLAASTGCLCPGMRLDHVAPEAPALKKVSWNGSQVVVRWCAPHSNVTSYRVTVGGQERQVFGMNKRSGPVGDIDDIAEVCVVAVNEVGDSGPSCMMYRPADSSVSLKAGLIGGALGFLLLLSLAILLWRHKMRRKSEARISTQDTAETQQMDLESRGGPEAV